MLGVEKHGAYTNNRMYLGLKIFVLFPVTLYAQKSEGW